MVPTNECSPTLASNKPNIHPCSLSASHREVSFEHLSILLFLNITQALCWKHLRNLNWFVAHVACASSVREPRPR